MKTRREVLRGSARPPGRSLAVIEARKRSVKVLSISAAGITVTDSRACCWLACARAHERSEKTDGDGAKMKEKKEKKEIKKKRNETKRNGKETLAAAALWKFSRVTADYGEGSPPPSQPARNRTTRCALTVGRRRPEARRQWRQVKTL